MRWYDQAPSQPGTTFLGLPFLVAQHAMYRESARTRGLSTGMEAANRAPFQPEFHIPSDLVHDLILSGPQAAMWGDVSGFL